MKKEELIITHILDNPQGEAYDFIGKRVDHGTMPLDGSPQNNDYIEKYILICVEIGSTTYLDKSEVPDGVSKTVPYWKLRPITKNFPGECAKIKLLPEVIILTENPYMRTHIEIYLERIAKFRDITVWDKLETEKQAKLEQAKKIAEVIPPIKAKLTLEEIQKLTDFIKTGKVD